MNPRAIKWFETLALAAGEGWWLASCLSITSAGALKPRFYLPPGGCLGGQARPEPQNHPRGGGGEERGLVCPIKVADCVWIQWLSAPGGVGQTKVTTPPLWGRGDACFYKL